MDLKTTTRPNRNAEMFRAVGRLLVPPSNGRPLDVANIGPGLAVKYLGRLGAGHVPGRGIFRSIETGVRRLPMPDSAFENYEAHELARTLDGLPFRLTAIDINARVVRIVRDSMTDRIVETVVADLGEEHPANVVPIYGKFDLVVALFVIGRVEPARRENACANVRHLAKAGGLIVSTQDLTAPDCVALAGQPGIYRRIAA